MKPRAYLLAGYAIAAAVVVSQGGCEALISGSPSYVCKSDEGCPAGKGCATGRGECVDRCDPEGCASRGGTCDPVNQTCVVGDATVEAGPLPPTDSGVDAPTKPYDLGLECQLDGDCKSNLCADSRFLSQAAFEKTRAVCSKTCCTSSDCDAGFFCHSGGKGGRYCLPMAKVGRGPQGAKVGGDTCTKGSDCRSGLCGATGKCVDTCCGDNQCKTGTVCRFADSEGVRQWTCQAATGSTAGTNCGNDAACQSNLCVTSCRPSCCSDTSCQAGGTFRYCTYSYALTNPEQPLFCLRATAIGSLPGQTCGNDQDCISGLCEKTKCMAVCCTDADCPGQACRPLQDRSPPLLRCVPK